MTDITSPQIVKLANEKARVFANAAEWAAVTAGTPVPNTTDNVADGSDTDGRKRLTGQVLNGLKTAFADPIVTWFEGASGVGSLSRIDIIRRVSVNGESRF